MILPSKKKGFFLFCDTILILMRIYYIGSKGMPSSSISGAGGVERHVEQIATRLHNRGHEVFVYSRAHANNGKKKLVNGVHILPLPSIRTKNLDTISHVFLATLHVLFQKADIIHYHGVGPATLSWIPRLLKRKSTVVATFHSQRSEEHTSELQSH